MGGINLPLPVMAGKHGIVLATLVVMIELTTVSLAIYFLWLS